MNLYQPHFYKLWDILSDICPVDKSNLTDCPLTFLRQMDSTQRLAWFMAQEKPDQILKLVACHQQCAHKRNLINIAAVPWLPPLKAHS